MFVFNFVLYVTYWKSNNKMIFYLKNDVNYYSKVGYIKTIIIRCLKANRKKLHAYFQTLEILNLYKVFSMVI